MRRCAVLLDAGPLVAILSRDDANHERCAAELAWMTFPFEGKLYERSAEDVCDDSTETM